MRINLSIRHAFTLIELAMVLAVTGLMVGFVLKTNQSQSYSDSECANITKGQLIYIQGAIERFARSNDRLPLPARRFVGTDGPTYGREAVAGQLTVAGGVTFGALPWQALQLPASFAGDCWGNKYTYMVTTALTTNDAVTGYLKDTVVGNIARKTSSTVTADAQIAYAVISHGPDKLGAVKLNYDDSGGAMDRKWCTGSTDIAYTNCLATAAIVMDAPINDGKDAGTAYFDDIIVAGGKPKILASVSGYYAYGWGDNSLSHNGDGYYNQNSSPKKVNSSLSYTSVSSGGIHVCALTAAGAAYCWGNNGSGELGDGTNYDRYSPVAVSGGLTFASIAAGGNHNCGLTAAGVAYCWGYNTMGSLGDGTTTSRTTPVAVSGGLTFASISIGYFHSCGLTAAGIAYCWGSNGNGQIGDNTITQRNAPTAVLGPGGGPALTFASIHAGPNHTCGLTAAGTAYCWGHNGNGQLGNNTVTQRTTPTAVLGPGGGPALTFASISAGDSHTCGLTTAGAAYCWGSNLYGHLGDGTTTQRLTPVAVITSEIFTSIYAGQLISCGLTAAGTAYCWGGNSYGTLGDGTVTNRSAPTAVVGGSAFTNFSVRGYSACGINTTGAMYCWGDGFYGALGNGAAGLYLKIGPPVKSTVPLTSISGGQNHFCGLSTTGTAYCWGYSNYGQVGDGTTTSRPVPTAVSGGLTFAKVSAGGFHTCGLTASGAAYCWGYNNAGRLGDGTTTNRSVPTAVSGGLSFASISTSTSHTCGLTSTGVAYCWGLNLGGQLGDGTTTQRTTPTAVSGGLTFASISAGQTYSCGVTTTGAGYCWGGNTSGRLGDGTTTQRTTPTAVSGGLTFASISLGGAAHSCGITTTGVAYCWGHNLYGTVGDGTTTNRSVPTAVSGGLTFASIHEGLYHTCGRTAAGAAYCWGKNDYSQLGDGSFTYVNRSVPTAVFDSPSPYNIKQLVASYYTTMALITPTSTCTDLWTPGGTVAEGVSLYAYQSAAPTGACVAEWRTCTNGSFTGSYTQQTCTPGCDARTLSWGAAPTCSGPMPALAGGGIGIVAATSGGTGTVNVSCSATGVLTLSAPSCSP